MGNGLTRRRSILSVVVLAAACSSATGWSPDDALGVSTAEEHTCAWASSGAWCWGRNHRGQIGEGSTTDRLLPARMHALDSLSGLAVRSERTCSWSASGEVSCWGGDWGNSPVPITNVPGVEGLALGDVDVFAWTEDGSVAAVEGMGGSGLADVREVVSALERLRFCGLTATREVWCWPNESDDPSDASLDYAPRLLPEPSAVVGLSMSRVHACAVLEEGSVACWGANGSGQLGDATTEPREAPTRVPGVSDIRGVVVGAWHSCAWSVGGRAWCWGSNAHGQLGDGTSVERHTPSPVVDLTDVQSMSAAGFHTCAATREHGLFCWGYNAFGQLGDGTTRDRYEPVHLTLD